MSIVRRNNGGYIRAEDKESTSDKKSLLDLILDVATPPNS